MITFAMKPKGIFQLALRRDRDQMIADLVTSCWVQALVEYVTGTMPAPGVSILERFEPTAFATYGFRDRSESYENKQKRAYGHVIPFYSPRRLDFLKLAKALTSPNPARVQMALRDLARQSTPHLKSQITKPGIGYRIIVSRTRGRVRIAITYRAARALNANPAYGKEFRDLSRANSGRRLRARAMRLYDQRMRALIASGGATVAA